LEPKQLLIVRDRLHGTDILGPNGNPEAVDEMRTAIVSFLDEFS
jgi:hypothetical protein